MAKKKENTDNRLVKSGQANRTLVLKFQNIKYYESSS